MSSTIPDFEAQVDALLAEHAPALEPALRARLAAFCEVLRDANTRINLTGIVEAHAMAIRHVLDSLTVVPLLAGPPLVREGTIVDLGSGGGVPGIPLALALPDRPVVLVESRERKAAALGEIVERLGLGPRVAAVRARGDVWLADQVVDTVVTRAIGTVREQLRLLKGVRGSFSRLVMMKGPGVDAELEAAAADLPRWGAPPQRHEARLPGDEGRRTILVFGGAL